MPNAELDTNLTHLGGIIAQVDPVRYTPAGKIVRGFVLEHRSVLLEAGLPRHSHCRVRVVAIDLAPEQLALIQPQTGVVVSGFLARERVGRENRLVLHAQAVRAAQGKSV